MNPSAYPLTWPAGKPRTQPGRRKPGPFTSYGKPIGMEVAYERVQAELDRLGGRYGLVSSDIELTVSGRPRADRKAPSDPGVCLYFTLDGKPFAMGCDAFASVQQNLAAIAGHIEATRRIARYGVATAAESLQAFQALPPPGPREKPWREVLGFSPVFHEGLSMAEARQVVLSRYRERAKGLHPDQGGGTQDMADLNAARDGALKELTP